MKSIRLIAAAMFFAVMLAASAAAQTTPATGTVKIAIINTAAFADPKDGINKYIQAFKTLETEFKPRQDEIVAMETKLTALSKDIENLSKASVADPKSIDAKREEGERMQLEYKYKQDQYKTAIERRYSTVIGPVQDDIGKALDEYGKQKGYQMILDISKDEKGMLVWADMTTVDITADFVKFYNARPATTTTTTPTAPVKQ